MATQTISPVAAQAQSRPASIVAYLGAAAFFVATVWYGLATNGVTVASEPAPGRGVPIERALHLHYNWLVTTLTQERLYIGLAIAGFLCLAGTALLARDLIGRDRPLARAGAYGVGAGAAAWVTGSIVQLGGHQTIGLMATHTNPIQTTNSISFTIDLVVQAFLLAAFAFLCAGMLAFTRAAIQAGQRGWAGLTLVAAVTSLAIAWSYAAGQGNVTDYLLLAGGVVVLPAWLVWTSTLARPRSS